MLYPAHFRQALDGSTMEIQTLSEHSRNTAELSSERLHSVRLTKAGYLAGLIHDLGKGQEAFRLYMETIMAGHPAQRGSVIHTYAAARFLLEHFHTADDPYRDMTAELLAFAAGAMLYVVVEELIPEAHLGEHSNVGTLGVMAGFLVMMVLDTALG